jgi:hypothetical protein
MRHGAALSVLVVFVAVGLCSPATAFVLGGGSANSDCRAGFGGVDLTDGESGVVCADGDPACDLDGANGTCRFAVSACVAIPRNGCDPVDIDVVTVTGLELAPPPLPSHEATCGPPLEVSVPANTAVGAILRAEANGGLRDIDYLNLCCRSDATPLAAARCALAVPLHIAGCRLYRVPVAARAEFARARALVGRAIAEPGHAKAFTQRAVRALSQVRERGRQLARRDDCGFAIALIASHALATLGAPVEPQ